MRTGHGRQFGPVRRLLEAIARASLKKTILTSARKPGQTARVQRRGIDPRTGQEAQFRGPSREFFRKTRFETASLERLYPGPAFPGGRGTDRIGFVFSPDTIPNPRLSGRPQAASGNWVRFFQVVVHDPEERSRSSATDFVIGVYVPWVRFFRSPERRNRFGEPNPTSSVGQIGRRSVRSIPDPAIDHGA